MHRRQVDTSRSCAPDITTGTCPIPFIVGSVITGSRPSPHALIGFQVSWREDGFYNGITSINISPL